MTGGSGLAAFVAAVFAIHPLHVEAVAWVSERKGLLSGLFFVLSLGAYLDYVCRPFSLLRYLTVAVFFALSLMSKPMIVTLPFVLLLLDYWPLGRTATEPLRRLIAEKIPWLLLTVASCVLSFLGRRAKPSSRWKSCRCPHASATPWSPVSPTWKRHSGPRTWRCSIRIPARFADVETVSCVAGVVGLTAFVLVRWRRNPCLPVGWLWYLGMLVPAIGLVQISVHAMADRYMYLPQIGLCLAVTWGTSYVVRSWPHRARACGAAASLVVVGLMACAAQQTAYWRDSETLWAHTIDSTSQNALA